MFTLLYIFSDWSLLILRAVLGFIFVAHGWPKIKDLKTTAANFSAMGFWPGSFWGTIVALVEFFGGIALILGLYTQVVAAFFVAQFLVIFVWKLAKHTGLVGGLEFDLLILAASLILLTEAGGALSLDKFFYLGGF